MQQCSVRPSSGQSTPNQIPPGEVTRNQAANYGRNTELRKEIHRELERSFLLKRALQSPTSSPAALPAQHRAALRTHAAHYFYQLRAPALFIFSKLPHSSLQNFRVSFLYRKRRAKEWSGLLADRKLQLPFWKKKQEQTDICCYSKQNCESSGFNSQ